MADRIVNIVDLNREINSDIDKYVNLKAEVICIIDKIENSECLDLIYKRYIHNKNWNTIADEMKYSEKHIHKIHRRALKEVEKIIMDTK